MKHLHFDSVGGASGDMILGALLDLGVPRDALHGPLAALGLEPFSLSAEPDVDRGLRGLRVTVRVGKEPEARPSEAHEHGDGHGHGQAHSHSPARHPESGAAHRAAPQGAAPHAPHRGLAEIEAMLEGSRLLPAVRAGSLAVFRRLADAEARVHGTTPQRIYFHEVGAVDALVDIVGACLAREWLGADSVSVGPLPLGSGTVSCAHGLLPVPAPAVAELLRGLPVQADDEPFELVTPTGAAILSAWRTAGGIPDGSRLAGIGYGLGQRRLHHRPNLLRALLFEKAESDGGLHDACLALECNLDDQTPELTGALAARLLEAGALDAFLTPIQMKKQRPAALLTVLCRPDRREAMLDVIFRESTTFGVRESLAQRTILERRHKTVETPFGPVRVKIGRWRGADVTASPEFEDCAQAAARAGVPVRRVIEAACRLCPVP